MCGCICRAVAQIIGPPCEQRNVKLLSRRAGIDFLHRRSLQQPCVNGVGSRHCKNHVSGTTTQIHSVPGCKCTSSCGIRPRIQ
jgi:hypothetical protein